MSDKRPTYDHDRRKARKQQKADTNRATEPRRTPLNSIHVRLVRLCHARASQLSPEGGRPEVATLAPSDGYARPDMEDREQWSARRVRLAWRWVYLGWGSMVVFVGLSLLHARSAAYLVLMVGWLCVAAGLSARSRALKLYTGEWTVAVWMSAAAGAVSLVGAGLSGVMAAHGQGVFRRVVGLADITVLLLVTMLVLVDQVREGREQERRRATEAAAEGT